MILEHGRPSSSGNNIRIRTVDGTAISFRGSLRDFVSRAGLRTRTLGHGRDQPFCIGRKGRDTGLIICTRLVRYWCV